MRKWDYLSTFKPPEHLKIENNSFFEVEVLKPGSADYDFVAKYFMSTFHSKMGLSKTNTNVKTVPKSIEIVSGNQGKILRIEKIYNAVLYEKFINEF